MHTHHTWYNKWCHGWMLCNLSSFSFASNISESFERVFFTLNEVSLAAGVPLQHSVITFTITFTYWKKEMKIKTWNNNTLLLLCVQQITMSKTDKICPLAIQNQIPTIWMHITKFMKILWNLPKLSSWLTDACRDILTDTHTNNLKP